MDLARYFSLRRKTADMHGQHHSAHAKSRTPLPLLANPINEDVLEVFSGSSDLEKTNTHTSTFDNSNDTTTIAGNGRTSRGNIIIYKQHTEASTIELFYDLFFVANLAYFTAMHQHTDAESLINYLKLFTLMWFNWLSVTLFDVRFSIDCVWSRIHKAIQFGIFTGFVYAGPVFDKYNNTGDGKSYHNFAIVLVIGRLAIASQYFVVMWQGRMFRQTLLPIGLSAGVHAIAAVGVVICIAEGLCIFLIAMVWRIISFKYTHLVERLQLLTLIIIGERIIGMVKSVSCITKGQHSNNMSEVGTVVAAVILLYLIWMLYFDQLSHDRFGTVRQQIWGLLHYPLHSAIVLCVEGNTCLIVWNSAVQALKRIQRLQPPSYTDPAHGYSTTADYLHHLDSSMHVVNSTFKAKLWSATYNWTTNLTAIETYTSTYGFRSHEWNTHTADVTRYMFDRAQVFAYEAHADSLAKLHAVTSTTTTTTSSPGAKLAAVSAVFDTTTMQFFVGAGGVVVVLAVMYWFNKVHKSKYEFGEIMHRVVVGFALVILGVALVVTDRTAGGFKFGGSAWLIPFVVLFFTLVLTLDNILLAIAQYTSRHPHSHSHSQPLSHHTNTPSPRPTPGTYSHPHASTPSLSKVHTTYTYPQAARLEARFTDSDITLYDASSSFPKQNPNQNPNPNHNPNHTPHGYAGIAGAGTVGAGPRTGEGAGPGTGTTPGSGAAAADFSYQNTPTSALPSRDEHALGCEHALGLGIVEVHKPHPQSLHTVHGHDHDHDYSRTSAGGGAGAGLPPAPPAPTAPAPAPRPRTPGFTNEGFGGSG